MQQQLHSIVLQVLPEFIVSNYLHATGMNEHTLERKDAGDCFCCVSIRSCSRNSRINDFALANCVALVEEFSSSTLALIITNSSCKCCAAISISSRSLRNRFNYSHISQRYTCMNSQRTSDCNDPIRCCCSLVILCC